VSRREPGQEDNEKSEKSMLSEGFDEGWLGGTSERKNGFA